MRYDAPWNIVKGHLHQSTPELDRWKATQQGHAAVPRELTYSQKWTRETKITTFIIGGGLYIVPPDLGFVLVVDYENFFVSD